MAKPHLKEKSPQEDQNRRDHQQAVKRSLIELPAFGLTVLATRRKQGDSGYENYTLPTDPAALSFALKGALRLEMMNSNNALWMKYRRLFGSNTKAQDLSAWRSRVYVEAFATGAEAAEAAQAMAVPGVTNADDLAALTQMLSAESQTVVLLQVNEVFLAEDRQYLFSDLLRSFIERDSRLLEMMKVIRILPVWKEMV